MTVLEAVRNRLVGDATILALVPAARMYVVHLPQKAIYPAISYFRVSDVPIEQLHALPSAREPRVQVDVWTEQRADAVALALAVRLRLYAVWTDTSILFQSRCVNEQDLIDPDINNGLYRQSLDFLITHGTAGGTV